VSTQILALNGRGGFERYADYGQWDAREEQAKLAAKETVRTGDGSAAAAKAKKLSYLEQREWDGMEERVLAAEADLEAARSRAADPAIASDAASLQRRLGDLDAAQAAVDSLYARWAELEGKRS
jgi:ATP-binding cassette subfamily F protein uup